MSIRENIEIKQSLAPQAVTTAVNGAGVDTRGAVEKFFIIDLGTFAGTTPTATIKLQESSDNSTFTDIAAADLQGGAQLATIDTTNDVAVYERGYVGSKQYLRVAVTATAGAGASLPMAGQVVLRGKVVPV